MAKAPRRKRDLAVSVTDDVEVMPCSNMLTAESDVPGFQYHWIIAHYLKVWPYSVFDIPVFDFTKQPFKPKWTMIRYQGCFFELNFCSLSVDWSIVRASIHLHRSGKKLDALEAIRTRNATSRLTGSVPPESLDKILQAGLRAPDHALLRPWKIVVVEGESRAKLGALFAKAKLNADPDQTVELLEKVKLKPLRAPVVLIVIARIAEHAKVPAVEQLLSAGAVAQNMCIAAHALGLGAIWRTGDMAYDPIVANGLGLSDQDKIVGFIYLGEIDGRQKALPEINVGDFVSRL